VSNVVKLNQFRKKKQREDKAKQAETNRIRHGRTQAEKDREHAERERATRLLEGKRLERDAEKPAANAAKPSTARKSAKVVPLLAGGNPQIAKADGDAPVQAYIDAMPDWKREVGKRLDALIAQAVPNVRKAVKWNSPFYGVGGDGGWFLSFHTFAKYVKVAFFRGTSLQPIPPGTSKSKDTRYLDIHEDDDVDQELLASWIRQASELPGWVP
jgi:hypothetical protein